jgi:hypothetical protein
MRFDDTADAGQDLERVVDVVRGVDGTAGGAVQRPAHQHHEHGARGIAE